MLFAIRQSCRACVTDTKSSERKTPLLFMSRMHITHTFLSHNDAVLWPVYSLQASRKVTW